MLSTLWSKLEYGVDNDNYYGGNIMHGLRAISENRLEKSCPEIQLWISVLIDAAKYRDLNFIRTHGKNICDIANLNYTYVLSLFDAVWEAEDKHAKNRANNVNSKKQ